MNQPSAGLRRRTFYNADPDYTRPLFQIPDARQAQMLAHLRLLYGEAPAKAWFSELERIIQVHCAHEPPEMTDKERRYKPAERFSESDLVLITYGDIVRGDGASPLLARLPNFFTRLHGPTKASTLGVGAMALASEVYSGKN
jgi:sucrose phosphorylase